MIRNVLLVAVVLLAGCSVPDNLDVPRSTNVATKDCVSLNSELISMRYLPFGDHRISAVCRAPSGAEFKIYPSPVYRH